LLNILNLVGDFVGFFVTSVLLTLFFKSKGKKFHKWKIIDVAATASLIIFAFSLLLGVVISGLTIQYFYIASIALVSRFIAITLGIVVANMFK
jgi:hypothetical protein